ncbi:hypothetical protein E6C67_05885 [Azospirillum sp. TSA2s]|nr:hypothetical protein E6C67_05885 [Azospirillum sp. TSA2s]
MNGWYGKGGEGDCLFGTAFAGSAHRAAANAKSLESPLPPGERVRVRGTHWEDQGDMRRLAFLAKPRSAPPHPDPLPGGERGIWAGEGTKPPNLPTRHCAGWTQPRHG